MPQRICSFDGQNLECLRRCSEIIRPREQEDRSFIDMNMCKIFETIVALRYALIPYLYSEFMKAALENDMNFIPLAFAYPDDERAVHVEDQILVGESIMIAPIYKQNAIGRFVYLPEKMKLLRFRSADDYDEEILEKGDHFVKADLQEVLVFLRPGHVLPLAEGKLESTDDIDIEKMKYITFEAEQEQYQLYWDDGISVIK